VAIWKVSTVSGTTNADEARPRWPTFGVKILPRLPEGSSSVFPLAGRVPIPGVQQLEALVATLVVGRDQTYLSQPCVARRTIEVDTSGVGVVEFDLSDAQKEHLYDNGWDVADRFLAGWGEDAWKTYLARCRGVIRRERARR
jgi:NTE family protein